MLQDTATAGCHTLSGLNRVGVAVPPRAIFKFGSNQDCILQTAIISANAHLQSEKSWAPTKSQLPSVLAAWERSIARVIPN